MAKILIIEDNIDTVKLLMKRVSDAGYDVAVAHDSEGGLKMVNTEKPDLVLLDLMLPGGGGEVILGKMRRNAATKDIPVIIISAIIDEECKRTMGKMNIEAYIEKPYDPKALIAAVKAALEKRGK